MNEAATHTRISIHPIREALDRRKMWLKAHLPMCFRCGEKKRVTLHNHLAEVESWWCHRCRSVFKRSVHITRFLKIDSNRNSYTGCGTPLYYLDWRDWWSDCDMGYSFYLHVAHIDKTEGTRHRVYCRHEVKPRIAMVDGVLKWVVTDKGPDIPMGVYDDLVGSVRIVAKQGRVFSCTDVQDIDRAAYYEPLQAEFKEDLSLPFGYFAEGGLGLVGMRIKTSQGL